MKKEQQLANMKKEQQLENDKNKWQVEKKKYLAYIILILGIIGQIVVFIIGKYINAIYSIEPIEALIISGVIIVVGILCWYIIRKLLYSFMQAEINGRKNGLSQRKDDLGNIIYCDNNDSLLCPLLVGLDEYGLTLKANDATVSTDDRLYEKEYVYKVEKEWKKGKPWSNIWIFSQDLSSEIDPSTDGAESVLLANITLNKTRYTMFYLGLENQESNIENRKEKLRNALPSDYKSYLNFVCININSGCLGKNTLPLLCGSIMFSQEQGIDNMPNFTEGYLSIRKNSEDIPIYYSMPPCMLKKYSDYYKDIIKNQ